MAISESYPLRFEGNAPKPRWRGRFFQGTPPKWLQLSWFPFYNRKRGTKPQSSQHLRHSTPHYGTYVGWLRIRDRATLALWLKPLFVGIYRGIEAIIFSPTARALVRSQRAGSVGPAAAGERLEMIHVGFPFSYDHKVVCV